jgi:hypothetical protein
MRSTWIAAAVTLAAVVAFALLPGYRTRLEPTRVQLTRLPHRLTRSTHEMRVATLGAPYAFLAAARERSFEDAILLISDRPEDDRLASILVSAYYLYPRTLVHPRTLDSLPDLQPDFVLATAHFNPLAGGDSGPGLFAVSDRARTWAEERW